MMDSIYDSIWRKDDLANDLIPVLRHNATQLWKILYTVCLGNQLVSKRHCTIGIITCDEDGYVMKVVASRGDQISL